MFKKYTMIIALLGITSGLFEKPLCVFGATEKSAPLKANKPILVPGGAGKFDWMTVDSKRRRLLAAHRDKGTLAVLDLNTNELISSVKTGACQGVIVGDNHYFAGDAAEHKVVILNAESLKQIGEVDVPGEIDAIAYDSRNHRVFADHDDGADIWVVQPDPGKVIATIQIPGVPEFIEYDRQSDTLYQNVKTTNTVRSNRSCDKQNSLIMVNLTGTKTAWFSDRQKHWPPLFCRE